MNRILIPLLILLGSFLYSWFWNCKRLPECSPVEQVVVEQAVIPPVVVDTIQAPAPTPEEELLFKPLDVYFESGKSTLNRNEEVTNWLATAKKYLEKNPNEKLSVIGHTDSDGDDASNIALSDRRANLVKGILVKDGFATTNLVSSGKGEAEPKAPNDTPENKAQNRRVSITLIK